MSTIKVPEFEPSGAPASKLAWFGITLLLATPSDLDQIKDNNDDTIRAYLAGANITGGLQDDLLGFIRSVANDPVTRQQMADLHDSLVNRASTNGVYDHNICPLAPDSQEILRRLTR